PAPRVRTMAPATVRAVSAPAPTPRNHDVRIGAAGQIRYPHRPGGTRTASGTASTAASLPRAMRAGKR
ncbi:MAG TPA: hypothetical protein VKI44_29385, partial [Acetobacteraceae bacterium]|nr:hypothetical protein [Acetobacteraceae bacterium]